jgi:Fe-S cluster biogenesis protein NfuA
MNEQPISITLEFTPNPNTLKFMVNRNLVERGAANFTEVERAEHCPLALKLFQVSGVQAVMVGSNFVTITKSSEGDWDLLAEKVPSTLENHLKSGEAHFDAEWVWETAPSTGSGGNSEIEQKVREVLDRDIRPAVAMDGGDITFGKFEDGIVYLHLQGSCSSCPSSVATLKMGVEARLRDQIPEVKEVVQI